MLLVCSEGKWDTISCGGSHRSLCYRVLLPGCRGLPALVLLPNWGVSTLCSLQLFSTAVSELESTLFKFYQIPIFLLYFVLTVGVLDKRWCLGYLLSFENLLKHFTLKFFRMRWVPIEGKEFPRNMQSLSNHLFSEGLCSYLAHLEIGGLKKNRKPSKDAEE